MYFWRFSLFTIFNRKTSSSLINLIVLFQFCCGYLVILLFVADKNWELQEWLSTHTNDLWNGKKHLIVKVLVGSWKGHNRIQKLITCTSESNILLDNVNTHNGLDLANSTTINCKRHRCCLAKNPVPLLLSWKSNLAPLSGKTVYDKYGEPIRQWQSEEWRELRELRMKHWASLIWIVRLKGELLGLQWTVKNKKRTLMLTKKGPVGGNSTKALKVEWSNALTLGVFWVLMVVLAACHCYFWWNWWSYTS